MDLWASYDFLLGLEARGGRHRLSSAARMNAEFFDSQK